MRLRRLPCAHVGRLVGSRDSSRTDLNARGVLTTSSGRKLQALPFAFGGWPSVAEFRKYEGRKAPEEISNVSSRKGDDPDAENQSRAGVEQRPVNLHHPENVGRANTEE